MNLPQFLIDLLTHIWGGSAQVINILLALLGSGTLLGFLTALSQAWGPLSWASAIAVFLVLLEWIPTLADVVQATLFGGGTKVATGDSVGGAMRMPWAKKW